MSQPGPNASDFPAAYVVANATSQRAQEKFKRLTSTRLMLFVLAAAFGVWSLEGGRHQLTAILGAICFLIALVIEAQISKARPEQAWYESRAAAESAKTLAWRYAVGGEPFGVTTPDPDDLLAQQMSDISSVLSNIDLEPEIGSGHLVTDWMRATRSSSLEMRRVIYEVHRVVDQQNWYSTRSKGLKADFERWVKYLVCAEVAGVVGAVLGAAFSLPIDLLGIAAASAAALSAWIQTNQFRTLQTAYTVTALELSTLRARIHAHPPEDDTEDDWAQFVEEAEKAFSREHTLWKASRGVQSLP